MRYLKIAVLGLCAVIGMTSCKQKAQGQMEAVTYPLLKVFPEDRSLSVSYSTPGFRIRYGCPGKGGGQG